MKIVPLSAETWPALAALFEQGGDPKWCFCMFWRKPGSNWTNTTGDDNKRDLAALVGADPAPGLVAMETGEAIGWVGLGPREDFPRLGRSKTIPQLPGDRVWSVNCFVVAKQARRQGLAGALLDAATAYAKEHGAQLVEGYPVDTAGARTSAGAAYTGTKGMFERHGFDVSTPTTSKAGGHPRVVARRVP